MKLKKKAKVMIVMTIVASLFSGCSFWETKIEYEPFVKALDEGDMKTVMSASDDGYAHVTQRGIYSRYEEKEDGEHKKTIYQTTEGVYNTKDKSLYGETTQEITTDIKMRKTLVIIQIIKRKLFIIQILSMKMDRYKGQILLLMFHT